KVLTPEEYKSKMDKKVEKRKKFGKTFLTTFAYALACVIVFASMAIAFTPNTAITINGGNSNVNSNVPANSPNGDTNNDTNTPGNSDDTNTPGDNKGDQPADPGKVDEIAQAVELYKTAMAKAKSSAKTVTHTKTGATNYKGIVEAGGLSSAASTLMGMFMKESEPNEVIDKAELPPKGGASKLTTATVKTATVKEEGKLQVVTITFKDAVNPVSGADGIGSGANVIEESQITGSISSVPGLKLSNIKVAYENVYLTCKIEKDTGNMTYLFVDAPCILSLDAKLAVINVKEAQVGIECKDEYTIAW
ncbi:MAG: hypothetical protein K2G60_05080, partial [Oscillospiraceae bacterium]|nr:hypothetical protein [Oscillospiraceae bacterium]